MLNLSCFDLSKAQQFEPKAKFGERVSKSGTLERLYPLNLFVRMIIEMPFAEYPVV